MVLLFTRFTVFITAAAPQRNSYWSEYCSSSQILPLTKGTLVRYNTLSGSVRRKEAKVRTDKLMLGFAYLRLSNEEAQGGESSSITNQRMIVQNYCKQNGISLVREFVDDGYSGGNFDRPAFQEMMKQLQQGKANTVITKDLSRLGRDMREASFTLSSSSPSTASTILPSRTTSTPNRRISWPPSFLP